MLGRKYTILYLLLIGIVFLGVLGLMYSLSNLNDNELKTISKRTEIYTPKKIGKFMYEDIYKCVHFDRGCPKLHKSQSKENGVFLVRVDEYVFRKLPYIQKVCPVCFPADLEKMLDTYGDSVVYTDN